MGKLPCIHLYPGDWLRDHISGCSLAAQGLLIRMLFIMHDSERYGYLCVNGKAMTDEFVARRCGTSVAEYSALLAELDRVKVLSRTGDGILFSRRMVKDAKLSSARAKVGAIGGKSSLNAPGYVYAIQRASGLVKLGASKRPEKRPAEIKRYLDGEAVSLLDSWRVKNMFAAESVLHGVFAEKRVEFEWFKLQPEDIKRIPELLSDKGLRIFARANRAQNTEDENEDEFPEPLRTEEFKNAWGRWLVHRREIGHALKPSSRQAQLEVLAKFGVGIAILSIGQSIEKGWQGLFPEKISSPCARNDRLFGAPQRGRGSKEMNDLGMDEVQA